MNSTNRHSKVYKCRALSLSLNRMDPWMINKPQRKNKTFEKRKLNFHFVANEIYLTQSTNLVITKMQRIESTIK